ncbi:MAG: hypothetical protein M3P06_06870 [Acidobacteriota bacterium]|nr:hypothetical protein [Acidobacteriota bacterium]
MRRKDGWSGVDDPEKRNLPDLIQRTALFADHDADSYYAIADEIEIVQAGRVGVLTLDCVSVRHFWRVLNANRGLFQVLENFHNAATPLEVVNRRQLLRALLQVEADDLLLWIRSRCAVLLFFSPDHSAAIEDEFPLGEWRRIHISPEGQPSMLTIPKSVEEIITVATRDLHDDEAMAVTFRSSGDVTRMERNYLAEIFSLNHLPDAPFEGGETPLIPPPAAPIVLSNGGFCIDGDEKFWSGQGSDTIEVADEQISPYPLLGMAYCRPTKTEFYVTCNNHRAAEGECSVFLSSMEGHTFVISIDGQQLIASVHREEMQEKLYEREMYVPEPMVQSMRR